MIELITSELLENPRVLSVKLDGNESENLTSVFGRLLSGYTVTVRIEGHEHIQSQRLDDFPGVLEKLIFRDFEVSSPDLMFDAVFDADEGEFRLGFRIRFMATKWKHPWSISEYREQFQANLAGMYNNAEMPIKGLIPGSGTFGFQVPCPEIEGKFIEILEPFPPILRALNEATIADLEARVRNDAMVAYFDFPADVLVPCEQYLLYFVQFLKDLGIKATADISHEVGNVLFSVTPDSKDVALDKIHEALTVFLQLPANPNTSLNMSVIGDVRTQQLVANVQHLQGQLTLAVAATRQQNITILQRDRTIVDQQVLINQQQQILSGAILPMSLKSVVVQKSNGDKEKLFGGLVSVGELEKFGVGISLAEIVRRLRTRLDARHQGTTELLISEAEDEPNYPLLPPPT